MKTENSATDPLWLNNVDPLSDVTPITICSNQISDILSNLDEAVQKTDSNVNIVSLPNVILAEPATVRSCHSANIENNYVVLKERGSEAIDASCASDATKYKSNFTKNGTDNFEDMLYFVCNLCPFLCTKQSKITDHLENAHKKKTVAKLAHLKCPACSNVFFHKMSLRSHLIHDHGVGNSDIQQIIQAIVFNANRAKNSENKTTNKSKNNNNNVKLKLESNSAINIINSNGVIVDNSAVIDLPKVEITETNAQTIFNNMMNQQPPPIVKVLQLEPKKNHKCSVPSCKVTLLNEENMTYHINCHKDNGFHCLECKESFTSWKSLCSHLWRLHRIDMELYSCDHCDYKSVSLAKLNNIHKLIHGDVKAYSCPECKKAFKNKKQLGNHKMTHNREYKRVKFTCELCEKNFSEKRQLRIHLDVVHEKIKPFLCNYCGYKGSSRSSLKMHIRQHTGEKPFTCDSCSYKTSDHNSLRRHKLRHTGQKPYKCSYCSYACIQSSTYKVHLKTKHPGQEKDLMFTCQECQFRSVNKEMYVSHMITMHDQRPTLE